MKLPYLNETSPKREFIDVFRGYNHNLRIGDGEFYDMKNLTSDRYPVLSTRRKRGLSETLERPNGIISVGDVLCYVVGSDFYIASTPHDFGLTDSPKKLVSMGTYVLIFPDKVYVNIIDPTEYGKIGQFTVTAKCSLCDIDGEEGEYTISDTGPEMSSVSTSSGLKYYFRGTWINTSVTPYVAKRYNYTDQAWEEASLCYIKVSAAGIGEYYSRLDSLSDNALKSDTIFLNSRTIYKVEQDYIVISGVMGEEETVEMTIEKEIPELDFAVEAGNRLWGCRHGRSLTSTSGSLEATVINEIYASKLGNFHIWDSFKGVSTDSYAASVGSNGDFMGAITYQGHPIFFKGNCMHIVYGNYPSNYQIETVECPGVDKESSKSLAIVNGVLYYMSRDGVYAYDGSFPVKVSSAFGEKRFTSAVAGAFGNKYYISMYDVEESDYSLFVYDTVKGMWHKEDNVQAADFAEWKGDLFFNDYADNQIKSVCGERLYTYDEESGDVKTSVPEGKIDWMAETGIIGIDSPDKKYVSRIDVRLSLEVGAVARIWAQYDSGDEWELICVLKGTSLRSFAAPIRPKRCDHLRLRIEGEGDVKIFSICKTIEEGSDV